MAAVALVDVFHADHNLDSVRFIRDVGSGRIVTVFPAITAGHVARHRVGRASDILRLDNHADHRLLARFTLVSVDVDRAMLTRWVSGDSHGKNGPSVGKEDPVPFDAR